MGPVDLFPTATRVGVDVGQKLDPTAIVVVEIERRDVRFGAGGAPDGGAAHYVARSIQRLPLGTTYPALASRLVEIQRRLRDLGRHPDFWVDATGVGQPVVDLLRAAGLSVRPVYITGSDQVVRGENGELRMGKAPMVSRLQVLLQAQRIHLPQTPDAATLCQELLNYEIRVNDNANAQFGAFRVGAHDDLATALGLACWEDYHWSRSVIIPPVDLIADIDRHGSF